MSEYAQKLAAIAERKKKLEEEADKLVELRKKAVSDLAEKCGILTASDDVLAGLFISLAQSVEKQDSLVEQWQTLGERFLKSKKKNPEHLSHVVNKMATPASPVSETV